jgi:tellurite resistance protein TerA
MIFALLFEGAARFSDVNARLIIKDHMGSEILINLDNPEQNLRFCTICMIEQKGDKIEITKEERYFPSHSQADERYGFGFLWKAGSK